MTSSKESNSANPDSYKSPFKIEGLYAISHHEQLGKEKLLADIEAALIGSAKLVQYRDKTSSQQVRLKQAQALLELCQHYKRPLLINDDIALCKAIGAQGVHLGQEDGSVSEARSILGSSAIIGVTCHNNPEFAIKAEKEGASYVALGSFFKSKTKERANAAALSTIAETKAQCSLPLVAIGGITLDNAPILLNEGVDALAVINDLFSRNNIQKQASLYTKLFNHKTI
jgi:thiamine-phosphate pyrophosphorylase